MSKYTAPKLIHKASVFSSLVSALETVPDHRYCRGKRFTLAYIIGIILLGFIKGKTSIEACVMFATARRKWFSRWFDTTHGVPDPTTITRALGITLSVDVIQAVNRFLDQLEGVMIEAGISLDGKTIRAISELKKGCKHFLSMFSHNTCRILDQEGVRIKENEIPATPRLISRHVLSGSTITADALLTQTRITKAIRESGGDYLLIVKGNHPELVEILEPTFKDPLSKQRVDIFQETRKTRWIKTVISLTKFVDMSQLHDQGWEDIGVVGKLERSGQRSSKRTKTTVNETIYFISSNKDLTPNQAYQLIRNHWHIENKLHWQKDVTWKEDRSRARKGNTPAILSYLRSLALSLIKKKHQSVTSAIETFTENPRSYLNLLTQLNIV